MDDDPDFVFAMSSAQQYAWIKEHQPELFERVQEPVADGPVRAGRRHVGRVRHQHARRRGDGPAVRARQAVLPRGASASRPRRSGCPTRSATPRRCRRSSGSPARGGSSPRRSRGTRPTGSRTTPSGGRASTAPGSSPTSRRSTPTTPSCHGAELAHAVRELRATRAGATRSLVPFGYGDGGGGPTREMLARAHRTARPRGLAPRVDRDARPSSSRAAEAEYPDARCGSGELYLEIHRGTYTTPGPDEAGQPAQRAPAARGRAVVRPPRPSAG